MSADVAPVISWVPPRGDRSERPWVLLHGSDGHETDLLPLAARVSPSAAKIAPRGSVVMQGGFAHFHRHPDRTIDEDDLLRRVAPLARLLNSALADHGLDRPPILLGFSNGAIMAAALLAHAPELFEAAVLLRPLVPFVDASLPTMDAMPILVLDAADDTRRSIADGHRQTQILTRAGAHVTHSTVPTGHAVSDHDVNAIVRWLDANGLA